MLTNLIHNNTLKESITYQIFGSTVQLLRQLEQMIACAINSGKERGGKPQ